MRYEEGRILARQRAATFANRDPSRISIDRRRVDGPGGAAAPPLPDKGFQPCQNGVTRGLRVGRAKRE
jgi:hypothetical protein